MIYLFLKAAVSVLEFMILARCILSFIPHDPYNSILRYVYEITEPLMAACGKYLPDSLRYPLDFTPMVALIVIQLVYSVLLSILHVLF